MSTSRFPPSATDYNRPLRRKDRSKLLVLLALEIESAARWFKRGITESDPDEMRDALRFIERQISFVREINSYADEFKLVPR